jgi:hypothetical protein
MASSIKKYVHLDKFIDLEFWNLYAQVLGNRGLQGDRGETGPAGVAGPQGETGIQGEIGPVGDPSGVLTLKYKVRENTLDVNGRKNIGTLPTYHIITSIVGVAVQRFWPEGDHTFLLGYDSDPGEDNLYNTAGVSWVDNTRVWPVAATYGDPVAAWLGLIETDSEDIIFTCDTSAKTGSGIFVVIINYLDLSDYFA